MIALCPMFVVASANAMLGVKGGRVWPGDGTTLVHHVGFWSHYDHGAKCSLWPLPESENCDELAERANALGVLSPEPPTIGEVLLRWSARKRRFTGAGIIVEAGEEDWTGPLNAERTHVECVIVEAARGARGGVRKLKEAIPLNAGHRFIEWVALDGRRLAGVPLAAERVHAAGGVLGAAARVRGCKLRRPELKLFR